MLEFGRSVHYVSGQTSVGIRGIALPATIIALAAGAGAAVASVGLWVAAVPLFVAIVGLVAVSGPLTTAGLALTITPTFPSPDRIIPVVGANGQDIVLGLLILWLLLTLAKGKANRLQLHVVPADVAVFVMLIAIAGSVRDADPTMGTPRIFLRTVIFPLVMYGFGRAVFAGAERKKVLFLVAIGAALTGILIWIEFAAGRPLYVDLQSYRDGWITGGLRAGSMLNGPNFASSYLALGLAAALPLASERGALGRSATAIALFLPTCLIATRSISGLIAMAVVFGCSLWIRGSMWTRIVVIAILVALSTGPVQDFIASRPEFTTHLTSINQRLDLLQTASQMRTLLTSNVATLLGGTGFGRSGDLAQTYGVGTVAFSDQAVSLHNTYLTLLFESGLLALIPYLVLLVAATYNAWRRKNDPVYRAGLYGVLVLIIAGGSGTLTVIPQVWGLGFFLLACAVSTEVTNASSTRVGTGTASGLELLTTTAVRS